MSQSFAFAFTSARIIFEDGRSYVAGPDGGRQDVTGVATLVFTDGTIQERDDSAVVDDLFYYAHNLDVWNAHIRTGLEAEAHYANFGWKEGRDPNAYFSTKGYLAANPDVRAAGIDPLVHYDLFGWKEGRDPGIAFSTKGYLALNPGVQASGIDPLGHYLTVGAAEGRYAVPTAAAPPHVGHDGVDYSYYLAANPDVRAAGVDPEFHFTQFGWREGRNPNAYFDTKGYLATYGDVAAAGVDPLTHYHELGFRDGRIAGPAFDGQAYLVANADVKAAGVDPLVHYLQFGQYEGRTAIAKPLSDTDASADAVYEDAAAGTAVGATFSWGGWTSPNLTYAMAADASGGGFRIDAKTGRITVADGGKLDYESSGTAHSYSVTVTATDGGFSVSKTVAIAVLDLAPSLPIDVDTAANTVAEGAAVGTLVGLTAAASDVNGGTVSYSLTDSADGAFAIDAATGVVSVADPGKIDFESAAGHAYNVTVAASDGTLSRSQVFSIGVTDVAPTVPSDANAAANTVAEGAAVGTLVGLTASSSDVNGPAVTYSLTDNANGAFAIDAATGVVSVADPSKIDFESTAGHSYGITVQATGGALSRSQAFTIAVTDVAPSVPVDASAAANAVLEGAAVGTLVGITVQASDVNGGAVSYSLTDSANGAFAINASTGVVSVADPGKIDFETSGTGHSYGITVQSLFEDGFQAGL